MAHQRRLLLALATLAILYAALSGLRTVGDSDLGWQLATGRYVLLHKQIPSHDVLSYTARGREWIYPPFSGVLFFGAHWLGGYAAISWLAAAACAGTVAMLLAAGGPTSAALVRASLAVLAVPVVAFRTAPRADLFSTLLFAPLVVILWRHHRDRPSPLWLLPLLLCLWANLHLGFVAGVALLAAYVVVELLELPFPEKRAPASARLRRAAPWLATAALATLVNPWGPRLYAALFRQSRLLESLEGHVGDWLVVRVSRASLSELLAWRNPDSAFWWLLVASVLAAGVALWRRSPGAALLLAVALFGSMRYLRLQALFAIVVVVVGGELLASWSWKPNWLVRRQWPAAAGVLLALVALGGLVGVRAADLLSNRHYLSVVGNVGFGPGVSWWYPERATAFLLRERLPGRILNDFNLGGYLTWRLGPDYPVSLDGRAVPFGAELFFQHKALLLQPPDSPQWQQQAERWGVNTVILAVARYAGLGNIALRRFCESQTWRPVYLDEVAALFVRNRPENAFWLDRFQIDCASTQFTPPKPTSRFGSRNAAELYNFHANAGWVLFALGRNQEAFDALERAHRIFADDPQLHLMKGSVLQASHRIREAEQEYRAALRLRESDQGWYAVGQAQALQGHYQEAEEAIRRAARHSVFAHEMYRVLGEVYLSMKQPRQALRAWEEAEKRSPYRGPAAPLGQAFRVQVAVGRARAWRSLGDLGRAVSFQEQAVQSVPEDPAGWLNLAELYQAQDRQQSAQQARQRARELQTDRLLAQ